jgi:hypothetical protein
MTQERYQEIRATLEHCFGIVDMLIVRLALLALLIIGAWKVVCG